MTDQLDKALFVHQALEDAIGALLSATSPIEMSQEQEGRFDRLSTALCARSTELEELLKELEDTPLRNEEERPS